MELTSKEYVDNLLKIATAAIDELKQIFSNGLPGQILTIDANNKPVWVSQNINAAINDSIYGIEWEKGTANIVRVGNEELHRTCPIQNRLRGCLHKGKRILHWLNPNGWGLPMDNGEIPVLDGSEGDVGVAMPLPYFVKVFDLDTKWRILISDNNVDGTWIRISPCIYSPNRTLTRINNEGLEEAFNACIKDDDETHVGGNKSASFTDKLHGKSRTGININKAEEFCNNRGNGLKIIDYLHYCGLQLLFYIEFANFNSQSAVNKTLTADGFKQGGLGTGVTNVNSEKWNAYNGYNPLIETYYQVEHNVGNKSYCDTPKVFENFGAEGNTFTTTPAYFHGIHLFGDIWSFISDILIYTDMNDTSRAFVYKLDPDVKRTEVTVANIKQKATLIGYQKNVNGYIKEFDLSNGPYFIPSDVSANVKQDYNYTNYRDNETLRILLVSGSAHNGSSAGVGYFTSPWVGSGANADVGFLSMTELD